MTDRNVPHFNVQLYQKMLTMFPSASPDAVRAAITKHNGHVQLCIEDVARSCLGPTTSNSPTQSFQVPRNHFPPDVNQRQSPTGPGTRSRSVSGVPGRDTGNMYGPGNQASTQVPQSAPILLTPSQPVWGTGFAFPSNTRPSNNLSPTQGLRPTFDPRAMFRPPPIVESLYPSLVPVTPTPKSASSPKPPVPPPTYRFYRQQQQVHHHPGHNQGSSGQLHREVKHSSLYPDLPSEFPQPIPLHMSSLNIVPKSPPISGTSYIVHSELSPPPTYGLTPRPALHSTSVNLQVGGSPSSSRPPEVHPGNTNNYGGSRGNGFTGLTPVGPASGVYPPYQSKVQISISPTGECIPNMQSHMGSNSPTRFPQTPSPTAMERRSPVTQSYFPSAHFPSQPPHALGSSQAESMSGTPSIFDQNDPELERLTHVPIKPLPSSQLIVPATPPNWNPELGWQVTPGAQDGFAAHHEPSSSGEAYSRDLIQHQRRKCDLLITELEKETLHLETLRKEVVNTEKYYFRWQVRCQDSLFFTYEELQVLRAEVRSLMVDCECMTRMVDLLHKGQVPLGETNEDFYKSINTGQQGPVLVLATSTTSQLLPPLPPLQQATGQPLPTSSSFRPLPPQPPTTPPQQQRRTSSPGLVAVPRPSVNRPGPPQDDEDDEDQKWACCTCTFHNAAAMEMCEMCEMPKFIQAASASNQSATMPFAN